MSRLIINFGAGASEVLDLKEGANLLGRGPNNDFQLEHPTVSTLHCEVICQEGAVLVRDCGSTNGTFINGQLIKEGRLNPGETLQLGDVKMVLEGPAAVVAIPQMEASGASGPAVLADGSMACLNHHEVRARRRCNQCQKCFCDACVHTLRRVGGKVIRLCPSCSGKCELLPGLGDGKPKKKSFIGSLWPFKKTLKMSRKRD